LVKETEHGFVLECCELDCDNKHFGTRFTSSHYHATQHLNTKHQTHEIEVNTEPRGKWAKKRKTTTPICTTQISQFFKPICPMSSLASSSSTTVASPRSGSSQISGCNANHVDSTGVSVCYECTSLEYHASRKNGRATVLSWRIAAITRNKAAPLSSPFSLSNFMIDQLEYPSPSDEQNSRYQHTQLSWLAVDLLSSGLWQRLAHNLVLRARVVLRNYS